MALPRKSRAAALSVGSNATLVLLKLTGGVYSHSVSVLSETIHSAIDLVAALIAFAATRTAHVELRPGDVGVVVTDGITGALEAGLVGGFSSSPGTRSLA